LTTHGFARCMIRSFPFCFFLFPSFSILRNRADCCTGSTLDVYSGGVSFESRPWHRVSLLRIFVFSSFTSDKCWSSTSKPPLLHFALFPFSFSPIILPLDAVYSELLTASLNKYISTSHILSNIYHLPLITSILLRVRPAGWVHSVDRTSEPTGCDKILINYSNGLIWVWV